MAHHPVFCRSDFGQDHATGPDRYRSKFYQNVDVFSIEKRVVSKALFLPFSKKLLLHTMVDDRVTNDDQKDHDHDGNIQPGKFLYFF